MPRLKPKTSVIKKLFALSGNYCAFPGCPARIVDHDGDLNAEICHIEAAEKGGERFNKDSNDEYRRSFQNLMLMCGNHHTKTNNVKLYTVEKLKGIKKNHENKNLRNQYIPKDEIVKEAIVNYMKQKNKNTGTGTQVNNMAKKLKIGTQIGTQNVYNTVDEDPIDIDDADSIRPIDKKLKLRIDKLKGKSSPPTQDVIDFRNDLIIKRPSEIFELPVSELKFRKKNGRIKSEVESYERVNGKLEELSDETQLLLRGFLRKVDEEKNEVLKKQIKHKGQLQPAIITCDGFLINGNRRKMILEELYEETHQDPKYLNMRVVILPDNVSHFDIKRIENRYQLQDEGKSDYHGLNRALTIRDNISDGYTLHAQVTDDPKYSDFKGKELDRVIKKIQNDYLNPLNCVERYLKLFNREGIYTSISESAGDREGRWQAFIDYSNFYYNTLLNPEIRGKLQIPETEIAKIEEALFKIIRKRSLSSKELDLSFGKLHMFLRPPNLKKYLTNAPAKKILLKIADDVDSDLPSKLRKDNQGKMHDHRRLDEIWGKENEKKILEHVSNAFTVVHEKEEGDKPGKLIEAAYKKLTNREFDSDRIDSLAELNRAIRLIDLIQERAANLKKELLKKKKKME